MTQEERSLLLKDLCARQPYNVKVEYDHRPKEAFYILHIEPHLDDAIMIDDDIQSECYCEQIRPYLRPMSSMTEEEKEIYHKFCDNYGDIYFDSIESLDYLNSIHVDYRGLIPKGLAIAVTEDNNPYKL